MNAPARFAPRYFAPLLAPLALLVSCSSGPSEPRLGSAESALAPPAPSSTAPRASDAAWVIQTVPILLGRPVRSFGELKFLTVAVARWGTAVVAEALMNHPAFVDRWTNVLLDRLQVDREGPRSQDDCYRQPLLTFPDQQAQAAQVVLHTQRIGSAAADPIAAPPSPGAYNMADVVRGALVMDNVFPAYRGHLFSLVTHRDPQGDIESHTLGDRFTQTFLNKNTVCLGCHNTTSSCSTARFTPYYDAWPRGHEESLGFNGMRTGGVDLTWTTAFDQPPGGGAAFPGLSLACGNVGADASIRGSDTSLFPPGTTNVWQLDAQLKSGYLTLNQVVASGAINAGTGGARDGRTIGAYWLAAAFTNDVWREVFGSSLTIANYVHRNDDERAVEWSLAEQSVIRNGWSLRSLLRTMLTSSYYDRVIQTTPHMPQVFEPFLHPEGPYTADFAGDAVHRRSADLLFRMKASALGWTTADLRHPYVSSFPSSTDPASPTYPTHDDAVAMSLYLSTFQTSQRTPAMSQIGMLGWEASAGRCDRPASIGFDWIDGLDGPATAPGTKIRDAVDALRYRLLGHGITHDASTAPEAGLPDGGTLSTEELALQTFLGRSLDGAFTSIADADTTLRNLCSVFTKSPYFMLEGALPESEAVDFNSPPRLDLGDIHGPDVLHGLPAGLNSDTPSDACNGWDYYFTRALPRGRVNDCTNVEFPVQFPWIDLCPRGACYFLDEVIYHPSPCLSCPQPSEWIVSLPVVDPRVEYTDPPATPARTGMFLLWTETATITSIAGQARIVRANGKVETSVKAGVQLAVGDGLEVAAGAQFSLTGSDGKVYSSPKGGMPKADDGATWLVMATGKSALPPVPQSTPAVLDPAQALAQVAAMRDASLNEEPGSVTFQHTVTSPIGKTSTIDDPSLNGKPDAVVLVSSVLGGVANNHVVGVAFDGTRWGIYNEDGAAMPKGATFSVRSMNASASAFVHTTTKANVSAHITYLDDVPVVNGVPSLNGEPYAALQITHVWGTKTVPGAINAHPVGVYYDGSRWAIYNEDLAAMPIGTAFTVKLGGFDTVTSSAATRNGNALVLDEPSLNGVPTANLFLTHDYDPPGAPSSYWTKVSAVAYDAKLAKWTIVNADGSLVADGVSFNVHRGH